MGGRNGSEVKSIYKVLLESTRLWFPTPQPFVTPAPGDVSPSSFEGNCTQAHTHRERRGDSDSNI